MKHQHQMLTVPQLRHLFKMHTENLISREEIKAILLDNFGEGNDALISSLMILISSVQSNE